MAEAGELFAAGGGDADAGFGDLEDCGEGGFEFVVEGVDLGDFAFEHQADGVDLEFLFVDFLK